MLIIFCRNFKKRTKFLSFFSGNISYQKSFILSVLFHGLLFALLSLMLNPCQISDSHRIPFVIDFVSVPGDEDRGAASQIEKETTEQYIHEKKTENLIADISLMKNSLSFLPSVGIQNGIKKTINGEVFCF